MTKAFVTLKTPASLKTDKIKSEVTKLVKEGIKTSEIGLRMEFVTSDEVLKKIGDDFRKLKNKIAFTLDPKWKSLGKKLK